MPACTPPSRRREPRSAHGCEGRGRSAAAPTAPARVALAEQDPPGLQFDDCHAAYLNFAASASVPRASTPVSAPTATNSPPQSSQRRASASTPVRMPGALPAFLILRIASSMTGITLGLLVSPV